MRLTIWLGSWGLIAAMIIVAGSHLSYSQTALLAAGIVLTIFNMILLLLCADAWREMCEHYEERDLRNT